MAPSFNRFNQISINSNNVREISTLFTDVYGIGPWLYVTFGDDGTDNFICVDQITLAGKENPGYSLIGGTTMIGNMEYELLEPVSGTCVTAEFMQRRNGRPGLQHICVDDGADFNGIRKRLDDMGMDREQSSCIDHIETCVMRDLTPILGCCLELHRRDADFRYPEVEPEFYPASNTMEGKPSPALGDTTKITYVVADADEVVKVFRDGMHVCRWNMKDTTYTVAGNTYPVRQFICNMMNITLELLQPLSEEGMIAEFLRENGSNAISIGMKPLLSDDELKVRMEQAGYGDRVEMTLDGKLRTLCDHMELLGLYIELTGSLQDESE